MSFPVTRQEMLSSGYRYGGISSCRGCGAPIDWFITPANKRMPMNPEPAEDGSAVPHWATCPRAKDFKTGQRS